MNEDRKLKTDDAHGDDDAALTGLSTFTVGWIFLAAGLVLAAIFMGWPIYQAFQEAPEIRLSVKGSFAAVAVIALALMGFCNVQLIRDPKNVSARDLLLTAVLVALCFGVWWMFKVYLESLGYRFPPL